MIFLIHWKIKLQTVARKVYGAKDVEFTAAVKKQLQKFEQEGWGDLPVCMAKHNILYR